MHACLLVYKMNVLLTKCYYTHAQMNGTLLATNNVTGISSTATSATITNLPSADFHEIEVI